MGLVFAIQPDLRRSTPEKLVLRTTKRRFSLGSGFLFVGALLVTMYLAAEPALKVLWEEGGFFDKALTAFFYFIIGTTPVGAVFCWFFEEVAVFTRRPDGRFDLQAHDQFFGVRWNRRKIEGLKPEELRIENWKGAINMAAVDSQGKAKPDRYATQGHWMLKVAQAPKNVLIERRAKVYDIETLRDQISAFMTSPSLVPSRGDSPSPPTPLA